MKDYERKYVSYVSAEDDLFCYRVRGIDSITRRPISVKIPRTDDFNLSSMILCRTAQISSRFGDPVTGNVSIAMTELVDF